MPLLGKALHPGRADGVGWGARVAWRGVAQRGVAQRRVAQRGVAWRGVAQRDRGR